VTPTFLLDNGRRPCKLKNCASMRAQEVAFEVAD
jgi:hypothetical protein